MTSVVSSCVTGRSYTGYQEGHLPYEARHRPPELSGTSVVSRTRTVVGVPDLTESVNPSGKSNPMGTVVSPSTRRRQPRAASGARSSIEREPIAGNEFLREASRPVNPDLDRLIDGVGEEPVDGDVEDEPQDGHEEVEPIAGEGLEVLADDGADDSGPSAHRRPRPAYSMKMSSSVASSVWIVISPSTANGSADLHRRRLRRRAGSRFPQSRLALASPDPHAAPAVGELEGLGCVERQDPCPR